MEKEELEDTRKWLEERLSYVAANCDLNEHDNKRAFNSLKKSIECVKKVENLYKEELK